MLNIYFAASISGGRGDQSIYQSIIELLKKYGHVLTEHIGNPNLTAHGESISDREIFSRDINWLDSSDVVIAEISTPSLGVGYELGRAESLNKPVLCLYKPDEKRHAMIKGNPRFQVKPYNQLKDIENIFNNYFHQN